MSSLPNASKRKVYLELVKKSVSEFSEAKAPRLGAALSYYTLFSIAPLLVICIGVAGWFFGHRASTGIQSQVSGLIGEQGGKAVQAMVDAAASKPRGGIIATVIGTITLLFGAAGVFGQLQDALNTIWEVAPKPGRGVWGFIRDRFLSFAMIGGICFLLLVSLVVSTVLAGMDKSLGSAVPGWKLLWAVVNFVVSLGVVTLLFALMYKILPDVKMKWRDVWIGAFVTAIFFGIGKWAIGTYLGHAGVSSAYGAAGSLVVVLLWVYYATQIFLFGAAFTKVYANQLGGKPAPDSQAVGLTREMRAKQGIPKSDELADAAGKVESKRPATASPLVGNHPTLTQPPRGKLSAGIAFVLGFVMARRMSH